MRLLGQVGKTSQKLDLHQIFNLGLSGVTSWFTLASPVTVNGVDMVRAE